MIQELLASHLGICLIDRHHQGTFRSKHWISGWSTCQNHMLHIKQLESKLFKTQRRLDIEELPLQLRVLDCLATATATTAAYVQWWPRQ